MARPSATIIFLALMLISSQQVFAFRNCDMENSFAFSAATQYLVGEILFDQTTGQASGTETIYNHANREFEGFTVCHVTYELSGVFEPVSGTFVLDGTRTNHSVACPGELIALTYPSERLYALYIEIDADGSTAVHSAASGALLAKGDLDGEAIAYSTGEECTIY